jgi:ribosomal-protein-alanine N-acetyltransferase
MENLVELHTERLILKSITPALIHHLFNTKSKEEIMTFFGFDEQAYSHYLDMHEKGMETHRTSLYFFVLVEKESNLPIGECGFHTWNATHHRAEVFYNMRQNAFKQKGYMTEALDAILTFGFTQLQLHRVEALIAAENTPSLKLLLRYGFTFEGTMREDYLVDGIQEDSECYSLLKWEWEKRLTESISTL